MVVVVVDVEVDVEEEVDVDLEVDAEVLVVKVFAEVSLCTVKVETGAVVVVFASIVATVVVVTGLLIDTLVET